LTVSYCAVLEEPPEYPEVTLMTPLTCSKTASTPQKHPPASTAVCSPRALVSGASKIGFGIVVTEAVAVPQAVMPRTRKRVKPNLRALRIGCNLLIYLRTHMRNGVASLGTANNFDE